MSDSPPFLRRVRIKNYKSIVECDVRLGNFNVIVGRNGSGKSNFLDALRFVADALETSLDFAFTSRGGIHDVFSRSWTDSRIIDISLEFCSSPNTWAEYRFVIEQLPHFKIRVQSESLAVHADGEPPNGYSTVNGKLLHLRANTPVALEILPEPVADRLYLVMISGISEFRDVYDHLTGMRFYNLVTDRLRSQQQVDSANLLRRDGSNLASVVGRMFDESPKLKERFLEFLRAITPEVEDVNRIVSGGTDVLSIKVSGIVPNHLFARNMSDGTLRVIGSLIASMQYSQDGKPLSLVAIEEPETALHPAAAAALLDALREAASQTQIIITSHSADLVDRLDLDGDTLLVARMTEGQTEINVLDSAGDSLIRDHLFTPGELLRMDQLQPKPLGNDSMSRLRVASIVEGDGEVAALPILLRRAWNELLGGEYIDILRPNRCKRDRLVSANFNELDRFTELAIRQLSERRDGTPELILVLVDAEDDLACQLGPSLLKRSQEYFSDGAITCVIANRCYETWFAAAAISLIASGRLKSSALPVDNPEAADLRKSWVKQHINRAKYSETADQPGLTAAMDLAECRMKSRSFDKLCRELEARLHITPTDEGPSASD